MDGKTIAKTIAERRKERGFTQESLGERLGVTGQAVSKWENASAMPDILLLPLLCETLGITMEELYGIQSKKTEGTTESDYYWIDSLKGTEYAPALLRIASRMLRSSRGDPGTTVLLTSKTLLVLDTEAEGMCFTLSGENIRDKYLNIDETRTAWFFAPLTDPNCLRLLRQMSFDRAVAPDELTEKTRLSPEEIRSLLLDLTERNIVGYDRDRPGKTGYCFSSGMTAILMALAGHSFGGYPTEFGETSWFTIRD